MAAWLSGKTISTIRSTRGSVNASWTSRRVNSLPSPRPRSGGAITFDYERLRLFAGMTFVR